MRKVFPFLWFDNQAEEAVNFYTSVFHNSSILYTIRNTVSTPSGQPVGSIQSIGFQLELVDFVAMNGGAKFANTFNHSVSFAITCKTQAEIDRLWSKLSAFPEEEQCGWCKDKFGVYWQIIPSTLTGLLRDPDPDRSARVMQKLLGMKKINIAQLKEAYKGM